MCNFTLSEWCLITISLGKPSLPNQAICHSFYNIEFFWENTCWQQYTNNSCCRRLSGLWEVPSVENISLMLEGILCRLERQAQVDVIAFCWQRVAQHSLYSEGHSFQMETSCTSMGYGHWKYLYLGMLTVRAIQKFASPLQRWQISRHPRKSLMRADRIPWLQHILVSLVEKTEVLAAKFRLLGNRFMSRACLIFFCKMLPIPWTGPLQLLNHYRMNFQDDKLLHQLQLFQHSPGS